MKKIAFALLFFLSNFYCAYSQNNSTNPVRDSASVNINNDSLAFYRQPAICDTLDHVFSLILDSVNFPSGRDYGYIKNDSDRKLYSSANSEKPMPHEKNIFNTPPYAFYCPYLSGNDSAAMFKVFTQLVGNVKECLLNGPAKDVEIFYMHDPDNSRILQFGYNVSTLKNGVDPKMKTVSVTVEFKPDQSGRQLDYFTLYRVNLIVHP